MSNTGGEPGESSIGLGFSSQYAPGRFNDSFRLGPTIRAATPQEAERNWLERQDQRLRALTNDLGWLAIATELDDPSFIAERRHCLSFQERLATAWIDYYRRYPVTEEPKQERRAVLVTTFDPAVES